MSFFSKKKKQADPSKKYGDYVPGDIDPTTGSEIIYIAYQTKDFYVTIDYYTNLNWSASANMKYADDFGEVISQVNLTEALVDRIFTDKKNRIAYKKILADVVARLLDEGNSKTARLIMEEAKLRVVGHSQERVRMSYINWAVGTVILVGVLVILIVLNKTRILEALGDKEIYRFVICTMLGGIGAFITTFSRFNNYQGSIISGLGIHRLDGTLRVFYGLIAGLIISLAIKGRVLAGFADNETPWILYFFAMIAGASEALIPNLIRQAETETNLVRAEPQVQDPIIPAPVPPVPVIPPVVPPHQVVPDPATADPVVPDPAKPNPEASDPATADPVVPDPAKPNS